MDVPARAKANAAATGPADRQDFFTQHAVYKESGGTWAADGDSMESRTFRPAVLAAVATGLIGASGAAGPAHAQIGPHPATPAEAASMVKPPEASSGGSSNPDHMPIKRPTKPTHDPIAHDLPASATDAK